MYYPQGIYNVFDYVNGTTRTWTGNNMAKAGTNGACLQATIADAQSKGGGIVLVPCIDNITGAANFFISGSPIIVDTNISAGSVVILGYGGATQLTRTDDNDMFDINNSAVPTDKNLQGSIIENLTLALNGVTNPTGVAINISNGPSIMLRRIYFQDFANCVIAEDALYFTMQSCTITYTQDYSNSHDGIALQIIGSGGGGSGTEQPTVDDCSFNCNATLSGFAGKVKAIEIQEATHGHYSNTTINGFTNGILFNPSAAGGGAKYHNFVNVTVDPAAAANYAVQIQPASGSPGGSVLFVKFANCAFACNGTASDSVVGVYLNELSGAVIDSIEFVGCSFDGFPGPGLSIAGGATRIALTGCIFYNNNKNTSVTPPGQIALAGGSTQGILITGTSCYNGGKYGVDITSSATNVVLSACNLNGNTAVGGGAANFSSPGTVRLVECLGYNDQQTVINGGTAPTGTATNQAAKNGYYGPSTLIYQAPATGTAPTVTFNGSTLTIPLSGLASFFLNSPYDTIQFSRAAATSSWVGE